jgi:hypothetical protein
LTKKLSDMTADEIQALEERIEMIEGDQIDMFASVDSKALPEPSE